MSSYISLADAFLASISPQLKGQSHFRKCARRLEGCGGDVPRLFILATDKAITLYGRLKYGRNGHVSVPLRTENPTNSFSFTLANDLDRIGDSSFYIIFQPHTIGASINHFSFYYIDIQRRTYELSNLSIKTKSMPVFIRHYFIQSSVFERTKAFETKLKTN